VKFPFDRQRLTKIFKIALPIILGMVSQNVLNLVDIGFVGRLGDASQAAVGMGSFANWLLVSFLLGLGSGVQATAARRLGEGKTGETARGLNAALCISLAVGIPAAFIGMTFAGPLFGLLNDDPTVVSLGAGYLAARFAGTPFTAANVAFRGYWNGTNRSVVYLFTIVIMHVVNIVLDWGLIFGNLGLPKMGVAGAGWATSISVAVGTVLYLGLGLTLARGGGFLRLLGLAKTIPTVLRLSIPAGFQQLLFSAGFVMFFYIAGQVGTRTLAASTVLINLALVCVLPGVGLGLAGASLVGQALGRKDFADARRWGWEVVGLGSIVMGSLGLVLALGNRLWLGMLTDSQETIALAVVPLMIFGGAQFLDGVGVVLTNVLVGVGDVMWAFALNFVAQWVLFLPVAWFFAVHLEHGMIALWLGMAGYRAILATLLAARFHFGGWTKARA
jgi:multidrug resistance protein, MATE family